MAWFRLYDDLLDNPKVQKLPAELFKAYVNILCIARKEDAGGVLPSNEDLAFYLHDDMSRVTSRVTALIEAKLIDENDGIRDIHNWKTLQYESDKDPTAKERKRREREKKNEDNGEKTQDDIENVTRDTTVTSRAPEQSRTDTESEQKEDAPQAPPEPPVEKKPFIPPKGVVKASQLPAKSEWAGTDLREAVEQSFASQNAGPDGKPRYANYPKEQKAINGICTMVRNLAGEEREMEAAKVILSEFLELTQGNDKFWSGQPFTPSGLSPLFDRVVASCRKRGGTGPPRDGLKERYERKQAEKGAATE